MADTPDAVAALERMAHSATAGRERLSDKLISARRAGIDAAVSNTGNANHYADANGQDLGSIVSGNLRIARERARYEMRNNGYMKGITGSLSDYVVGIGPRLQLLTEDSGLNGRIEEAFAAWCEDCSTTGQESLGDVLHLLIRRQCGSGDFFAGLVSDMDAPGPVKLRLQTIAPERVQTPLESSTVSDGGVRDGIRRNRLGRPVEYFVLKTHPGNVFAFSDLTQFDTVPAAAMIHLFRIEEEGQHRGLPWMLPGLPLFAQMRRFTLATLDAAETAADMAGVIRTNSQNVDVEAVEAMDPVEIQRRTLLTLPMGWGIDQLRPEHPATSYPDFKREIIAESARAINMPYNIAAADSRRYNYASGRLDHQSFYMTLQVLQGWLARRFCQRVLAAWLFGARFTVRGLYGLGDIPTLLGQAQWFWKGPKHVDPIKEAKAETERLANGTTTLPDIYAEQGLDWEGQLEKRLAVQMRQLELAAKLKAKAEELGLSEEEADRALTPAEGAKLDPEDLVDEAQDVPEAQAAA